jgi:hypothetical protein
MSEEKTIYIGNGQKKGETWLNASVCLSNIPKEHTFEYNGKKYMKVNINIKDELDQYGNDVSISVDTWKPEKEGSVKEKVVAKSKAKAAAIGNDDLPF